MHLDADIWVKITFCPRGCEWEGSSCSCFYSSHLSDEACCTESASAGGDKESALKQRWRKDRSASEMLWKWIFTVCVRLFFIRDRGAVTFRKTSHYTQLCGLITGSTSDPGLYKFPWYHKHRAVTHQRGGNTLRHGLLIELLIFKMRVLSSGDDSLVDSPSNRRGIESPQERWHQEPNPSFQCALHSLCDRLLGADRR